MTVVRAIAQMFAVTANIVLVQKVSQSMQKRFVQWGRASNRQGETVADERYLACEFAKFTAGTATDAHPVFGRDFQETDGPQAVRTKRAQKGPSQSQASSLDRIPARVHG